MTTYKAAKDIHSTRHHTGGADPIAPADIGATTPADVDAKVVAERTPAAIVTDGKIAAQHTSDSSTFGTLSEVAPQGMRALSKAAQVIIAGTTAPVRWLSFGDSVAAKKYVTVEPDLARMFGGFRGACGLGGAVFGISINASTGTVTDSAAGTDPLWVTGETSAFGSGATRTYGVNGGVIMCDTIKVYWLNVGGTFKIQVDGVDNTTPTVTSDNSLGVATITVAHAPHTVTIVQLTGTPKIVQVGFDDTTVSGLVPCYVTAGGITIAGQTTQALTNLGTYLADLRPTVITFEMKETQSTFAADLSPVLDVFAASAPLADTVLIGSTPTLAGDANQVAQNFVLRDACRARNLTYFDGYTPFGSYAALVGTGWEGDGIHVAAGADRFLGVLLLRFLGVLDLLPPFNPVRVSAGLGDTADAPYWCDATTSTFIDVAGTETLFTAPPTGKVSVRVTANYNVDAGAWMWWNLREGAADIANSSRGMLYNAAGVQQGTASYEMWINGLVPGSVHTYKLGMANKAGGHAYIAKGTGSGPILITVTAR